MYSQLNFVYRADLRRMKKREKGIVLYVMLGRRISFKRIAALIQYSTQKHTMGYIGKRPNIVLVNKGMV